MARSPRASAERGCPGTPRTPQPEPCGLEGKHVRTSPELIRSGLIALRSHKLTRRQGRGVHCGEEIRLSLGPCLFLAQSPNLSLAISLRQGFPQRGRM